MSLTSGTRLGPYEIQSALGSGGMGEVYRARDTRLDRTVAIKVLATDLAADADLRTRFEREARAIAALDHPHICTVHDVGQHDGVHFLVMQHLEGETLAARLAKSPNGLPLAQALKIGIEIADALDKTHRAGITHRDLKPANIMLTKAGAKLLDFGLAKLRPTAAISMSGMTRLATTPPGTASGTILGTVHYMAPEQVEGREADARSDIWALGAVLYEMVTGRRPFDGNSPASVIGSILKDDPPRPSSRQPLAPVALDHVVERCLAKDREERWQSAGDVRHELAWLASADTTAMVRVIPGHRWLERAGWMALITLLAGASSYLLWSRPPPPNDGAVRLSLHPPNRAVFSRQPTATVPAPQFAVSPDGRSIAFVAALPDERPTVWVRSLEAEGSRQFVGTDDAQEPFWSPDGQWVAFFVEGTLRKVRASGGAVQTITDGLPENRGGSWGSDDTILIGTGTSSVYRVAATGGVARAITQLDVARQEGSHRWPRFLPDGRHFLFTVRSGAADQRGVYVGSVDGDVKQLVLRSDASVAYASGHLLFLEGDSLVARPFETKRFELTGPPVVIATKGGRSSNGNAAFSVSTAGTLAYAETILQLGRLQWFSRTGDLVGSAGREGDHDYSDFRLSPDERFLAASIVDPTLGVPDIWMTDLARGSTTRLTFGPAVNAGAVWSPDGERIIFRTNRKGLTELYQKNAATSGNEEPVLLEETQRASGLIGSANVATDWSPDGQSVVLSGSMPADLWVLPLSEQAKPVHALRSAAEQWHANVSPDGRFVAYTSNETGQFEVYVRTFPAFDRPRVISTKGGYEPRWRGDSRELYYLSQDRKLMAVSVGAEATPVFGVSQALFQARVHEGVHALRTRYVPSRDGRRFLVQTQSVTPAPVSLSVVVNWTAALKQ